MKVAISTDNNTVSAHFGRCPEFTIVEIQNNQIVEKQTITNPGHHPGSLPQFLKKQGVNVIITGGMGHNASSLFSQAGIRTIVGITGPIEETINSFLKGTLKNGNTLCMPGSGKGYGIAKTEKTEGMEEN